MPKLNVAHVARRFTPPALALIAVLLIGTLGNHDNG